MKAKFGSIVVAGSGKIGGHVASRNKSGAYFRTKVTPSNPQSVYQQIARNVFSDASRGWAALTDAQRAAWNSAKQLQIRSNNFGDQTLLSGKALYVSVYVNRALAGQAPLSLPVNPSANYSFAAVSAVADKSDNSVDITYSPVIPNSHIILVFATPCLSPGISFVKNQLRKFHYLSYGDVSPADVSSQYLARFGDLTVVGQKIHFRFICIEVASGIAALAGECVSTIQA
jgi:hypothetical protein